MKRLNRWQPALAALLSCAALACDHEKRADFVELRGSPPVAMQNGLLYLAHEGDEDNMALLLDVSGDKPRATLHDLPEGETKSWPRPAHDGEALIMTQGRAAELGDAEGHAAVGGFLLRYARGGELARYPLPARFSQLSVSEDGRFAITFAPTGTWASADSVAIIDLEEGDLTKAVTATTLRALNGLPPSQVTFAPATGSRRLAVLVMADAVNLLDLENPALRDKVLPLKLPNGSASLRAKKILFHGDRILVQPEQGSDVLVVRLEDDAQSTSGYRATLSTLSTDPGLRDFALLEDQDGLRVITLSERSVRVIDAVTGAGESTMLNGTFDELHLFEQESPFDPNVRPRALLHGGGARVAFVDIARGLRGVERNVEVVTLPDGAREVLFSEALPLAIVAHATSGLSLLDLKERTVSSLSTDSAVRQTMLEEDNGQSRAWVTTSAGEVGILDLATRTPNPLLLDGAAQSVVLVPGDAHRVAITHAAARGRVTLLDANSPSPSTAREMVAFTLAGLLD